MGLLDFLNSQTSIFKLRFDVTRYEDESARFIDADFEEVRDGELLDYEPGFLLGE